MHWLFIANVDIDECESNTAECISENTEECVNTAGEYICRCRPGYTGKFCENGIKLNMNQVRCFGFLKFMFLSFVFIQEIDRM